MVVLAAALTQAPSISVGLFAVFCAATALSERFQVDSDDSLDAAASQFSFSSGIHLAAVVVAGPWVAVLAAAFGVVFVDRLRAAAWQRVGFNASVFALSTIAGAAAFTVAGGEFGRFELPTDILPFVAMACAYAVVNDVLVAIVLAFASRSPLVGVVRETCRSDWSTDATEAALGALVIFVVLHEPWALLAVAPLAFAAYQAHARLALVRRETALALETFANVVDERDPYTYRHSARVADYVERLAEALHLPASQIGRLRWAGRLHDLGKVAVDAAVLRRPGKLEDDEWIAMRRHPRLSARILRRFHLAGDQARAVEFHHERFDGGGYYGVAGRDLPLATHFLVVADSYDAMTTDRPYRTALSHEQALAEIEAGAGTHFHPMVARAFVAQARGEDPLAQLSLAERAELSRAFGARSRLHTLPRPRAEGLILAGGTSALLGVGLALFPLVGAGIGLAFGATAWLHVSDRRARKLARQLNQAAAAGPRETFDAVAAILAEQTKLAWAGLVRWEEETLDGGLELEWNALGHGPREAALTSWIVREADSRAELLEADARELGSDGRLLALPLRRDGALTGFLALSFQGDAPRHVRNVVAALTPDVRLRLAEPVTARPALRAAS